MVHRDNRSSLPPQPLTRLATLLWTLLAIALLAALIFVRQAEAVTSPPQAATANSVEDEEFELEEESEGEEGEEEEFEDEEDDEELGIGGPLLLPPECLLHTAQAQVAASASNGLVRLAIRYTSYAPTDVSLDYWLKGSKGSLRLKGAKRHFGRQGVVREEERVSDRAMTKVLAARAFIVQLGIPGTPPSCRKYSTQRLTVKHAAGGHATWSRPH
jgi:hypothetical protein